MLHLVPAGQLVGLATDKAAKITLFPLPGAMFVMIFQFMVRRALAPDLMLPEPTEKIRRMDNHVGK